MKKSLLLALIILVASSGVKSQRIYGLAQGHFGTIDLSDYTSDTLIYLGGGVSFRSAIDRYNGRYFFGGTLPGHSGNFHIIDLTDLSIESHSFSVRPENMEYDMMSNRIVHEKNGVFYSLDLSTMEMSNLGVIETGNSLIYGQMRTYIPQTNQFMYVDYIDGPDGDPYYVTVDASTGAITCETILESENEYVFYGPAGLVTNNLTGEIIGHRNGRFGIVDPCNGVMTKLSSVPEYYAQLDFQMAVYNHWDNTYIIPYYSTDTANLYKIAIVDVYQDEIVQIINDPWRGKMNMHQIYDQPIAPIVLRGDTLFVPKGLHYKWFLNENPLGETTVNYWIPEQSGVYRAEVDFREYTTTSTTMQVTLTSIKEPEESEMVKIYPNPASDFLLLHPLNTEIKNIRIMDITGSVVLEQQLNIGAPDQIEVPISKLSRGSYLVEIETPDRHYTRKIIKI